MAEIEHKHNNFVADLDLTSALVNPQRCIMWAPFSDLIKAANGSVRVGVLATMIDVACSDPALANYSPDWTATQELAVQAAQPLREGPVVIDARLVRIGKKTVVTSARIFDARGETELDRLCALGDAVADPGDPAPLGADCVLTFARIPRAATRGVADYNPGEWVGQVRRRSPLHPATGEDLNRKIGIQVVAPAAGIVEVASAPYVINAIGTINGGVQAIMLETAAELLRPGMVATDIQIKYLSQMKAGPARTRGRVLRDAPDHSVVALELVDAGNDNKLLTLATVLLQK